MPYSKNIPKVIVAFALLGAGLAPVWAQQKKPAQMESFSSVKARFQKPGKDYGTAPFWVWNTKVTKPQIDSMLHDYRTNDFGGLIIHARPGLITEYLSKDWFDLFNYATTRAKQLGLNIWIYDENSYPTGFAGGLVADEMPEAVNQGQMLQMTEVDHLPVDTAIGNFIYLKEQNGSYINVSNQANGKKDSGHYFVFKKVNYKKSNRGSVAGPIGVSYVDLMAKGVSEKFIDVTYKAYEKTAGQEFGKTIKGVFSDEPTIINEGRNCVRITPDLFSTFQKKWGYDLKTHLPSLFMEVGDWRRVRHNYFQVLLQLFIDRWSKPVSAYMEKHNLVWTGHYWEHGWPSPLHGPDNMAMYAWEQMPGIDMLFNQFNEEKPVQFGNIRAVRELGSVANQLGKKRTLSETYGGGGWELTFKDMRRLADWQYVLGVNFMNQHLSFMTLTGARKYDYPQSFSYHEPWWPYYKSINHYYERLSYLLSTGQQYNDVLVIEPTTSAWMYYYNGNTNKRFNEIAKSFNDFVTAMQKSHVEYDLGSENIIKNHGSVKGRSFVIGQRSYKCVVIPPGMENIDGETFALLKKYIVAGGKVVAFEQLKYIDGAANAELTKLAQLQNLSIVANLPAQFPTADFNIRGMGNKAIGGNIYYQRRRLADGELIFLSNASMDAASAGQIQTRGKDVVEMNLTTGALSDYDCSTSGSARVNFLFNVPPAGSLMLFVSDHTISGINEVKPAKFTTTVKTSPLKVIRPVQNSLNIDFCDLELHRPDSAYRELHVGVASNKAFKHYGFVDGVGNPWNNRTQYRNAIVRRDTFSKGTGYTATYHFTIKDKFDYSALQAVTEQPQLWTKVTINGVQVKAMPGKWWLDRTFGVYAVGQYVKEGDNQLAITVSPMRVFAEIEPVYILGDFNLQPASKGWVISKPQPLQLGSWKEQGLPLYGRSVKYAKECYVYTPGKHYQLQLGKWHGTVVAVKVNGVHAGIIISEPNCLDITPFMKKGNNHIEVEVVGSLKNLLGPFYRKPAPGLVDPQKWYNINAPIPGKQYDLYNYGLDDDFEILSSL